MNEQNINTRVYAQKVEILPEWDGYEFEYFKDYPSVQWKLFNLKKLAKQNPKKLQEEAYKLKYILTLSKPDKVDFFA